MRRVLILELRKEHENMNIKVWTADVGALDNDELFRWLYARVSDGRKEKIDRMRFRKDKNLSLGAGVLLENALAVLGVQDRTMSWEKNQKPCLAHRSDIKFNLSHSGTKVMCAISDSDIGCDVEKIGSVDWDMARLFFCGDEYDALLKCPDGDMRRQLFFRYWTMKESFMKATGLGLMLPLDAFCMRFDGSAFSVRQYVDNRRYFFRELPLDDGYQYAICSAEKPVDTAEVAVAAWEQVFHS